MSMAERLAVHRQSERNNAERVRDGFLKMQKLSNKIRVVVTHDKTLGFMVEAQQYLPNCSYPWEVAQDGWRMTQMRTAPTFEGAMREFDSMVRVEQRYLEMRSR